MSKIGKKPISLPAGVEVKIENEEVIVRGPKGELSQKIQPEIRVNVRDNKIFVFPQIETKKTKAFWGLNRALISNMIKGVSEGFEKKLEIEGLGYKAQWKENFLELYVGFTCPVKIVPPPGIKISVKENIITVWGINKELVGQVAAQIRKVKPPDPYKGKGIRYLGEVIRKKAGKKAVTTAG